MDRVDPRSGSQAADGENTSAVLFLCPAGLTYIVSRVSIDPAELRR